MISLTKKARDILKTKTALMLQNDHTKSSRKGLQQLTALMNKENCNDSFGYAAISVGNTDDTF